MDALAAAVSSPLAFAAVGVAGAAYCLCRGASPQARSGFQRRFFDNNDATVIDCSKLGSGAAPPEADLEVSLAARLAGVELVAVYFSAHWCGPCQKLTPILADFHSKLPPGKCEMIFASSCTDETEFAEYAATMPWLALPWAVSVGADATPALGFVRKAIRDTGRQQGSIAAAAGLPMGLPSLAVFDVATGELVVADACSEIVVETDEQLHSESWVTDPPLRPSAEDPAAICRRWAFWKAKSLAYPDASKLQ